MRLKWIDSLRGLAAFAVVLYHVWNRYYPAATTQAHAGQLPHSGWAILTLFLFGFGYLGVNLFFVLSGFCIHLPQARRFRERGSDELKVADFAQRRFWRLYPAYFASLFWTSLCLILLPFLNHLARHAPFSLLQTGDFKNFLVNAFFVQMFFPKSLLFNGVYWTLLYELYFYICYPTLLWICRKAGFSFAFWFLFATELLLIFHPPPVLLFFASRLFEWFLGMYLAEMVSRPPRIPRFAFPLIMVVTVASLFSGMTWRFHDVLASIGFAALVGVGIQQDGLPDWLERPQLVKLGLVSYSLYLIHVPMIDIFWNGVTIAEKYRPAVPHFLVLLSIPASLIAALFFFKYFEEPFLRGRPKKAQRAVREPSFAPVSVEPGNLAG